MPLLLASIVMFASVNEAPEDTIIKFPVPAPAPLTIVMSFPAPSIVYVVPEGTVISAVSVMVEAASVCAKASATAVCSVAQLLALNDSAYTVTGNSFTHKIIASITASLFFVRFRFNSFSIRFIVKSYISFQFSVFFHFVKRTPSHLGIVRTSSTLHSVCRRFSRGVLHTPGYQFSVFSSP